MQAERRNKGSVAHGVGAPVADLRAIDAGEGDQPGGRQERDGGILSGLLRHQVRALNRPGFPGGCLVWVLRGDWHDLKLARTTRGGSVQIAPLRNHSRAS